jgi:hypothetical protein
MADEAYDSPDSDGHASIPSPTETSFNMSSAFCPFVLQLAVEADKIKPSKVLGTGRLLLRRVLENPQTTKNLLFYTASTARSQTDFFLDLSTLLPL